MFRIRIFLTLIKVGVFKIYKVSLVDQLSWLEDLPSGT